MKAGHAVRHDAFAAGAVDGRSTAIKNDDLQAHLLRFDRGGKPCRAAPNNDEVEDVSHLHPHDQGDG